MRTTETALNYIKHNHYDLETKPHFVPEKAKEILVGGGERGKENRRLLLMPLVGSFKSWVTGCVCFAFDMFYNVETYSCRKYFEQLLCKCRNYRTNPAQANEKKRQNFLVFRKSRVENENKLRNFRAPK